MQQMLQSPERLALRPQVVALVQTFDGHMSRINYLAAHRLRGDFSRKQPHHQRLSNGLNFLDAADLVVEPIADSANHVAEVLGCRRQWQSRAAHDADGR